MLPPEDLMALQNVVTPQADLAGAQIAVLPPEDSVVVQVYFQGVHSQEVVLCPVPARLPASRTPRKTELLVTSSA